MPHRMIDSGLYSRLVKLIIMILFLMYYVSECLWWVQWGTWVALHKWTWVWILATTNPSRINHCSLVQQRFVHVPLIWFWQNQAHVTVNFNTLKDLLTIAVGWLYYCQIGSKLIKHHSSYPFTYFGSFNVEFLSMLTFKYMWDSDGNIQCYPHFVIARHYNQVCHWFTYHFCLSTELPLQTKDFCISKWKSAESV
jgi:hypothetical protein